MSSDFSADETNFLEKSVDTLMIDEADNEK